MKQPRNDHGASRHAVAAAIIALVLALLSACANDDPTGIDPEGEPFLEEVYQATVENDLQYGAAPDENGAEETLLLDLFQPTNDEPLRPALIWLHGGSFQEGHKGTMTEFARRFAQRGFVSASVNYRLREDAEFDYTDPDDELAEEVKRDAQHDIQAAVRWLRANAGDLRIDPDLIFVAGYSAGGTAALRVAAYPDDSGSSGNPGPSSSVAAAVAVSGSLEPGILEAPSGPTLLIHGENDTKVPFEDVEAACSSVARCRLVAVPSVDHNSLISIAKEDVIAETAGFLHAELTGS